MRLPRHKPFRTLRLLGKAGNRTKNQRQGDNRARAFDRTLNH
jgi:hypothetical protein